MIGVQDIRNGTAFLLDGHPWIGIKYEHIKMGRGSATIKIKMRNLETGAIIEKAFINSAKVEEIDLVRRAMQSLYRNGSEYVFMNPKDYSQVDVTDEVMGDAAKYIKDDITVNILFWGDRPMAVELPPKMEFVVTQTDPGVKGNSVSNLYKPAVLENGVDVKVPLFINEGDKILVDTRDGTYVERVQ